MSSGIRIISIKLFYRLVCKLEVLSLSDNALEGELPSCLANLSSLYHLDIYGNQFIGNGASIALASLTLFKFVSPSRNLFEVQSFFMSLANHSSLKVLFGNQNKLIEEPTTQTWVPKFQLKFFRLSNCKTKELNNEVPKFLYYQNDLRVIYLSYNNFGGKVPLWLFENNTITGAFLMKGNSFISRDLQFSSHPNPYMFVVDLSENKIQGQIPTNICSIFPKLRRLNLSSNILEGNIPPCLGSLKSGYDGLYLDLSHNQLSGGIPENIDITIVRLSPLMVMDLSNNNLYGELPRWISNLSDLVALNISENQLTGEIPNWVGTLSALRVLFLKANFFMGEIPIELCKLHSLNIIVLSQNNLSSPIPFCLSNLTLEPNDEKSSTTTNWGFCSFFWEIAYHIEPTEFEWSTGRGLDEITVTRIDENQMEEKVDYTTKRATYIYKGNILNLDLSRNNLSGIIPTELTELYTLEVFNVSYNNLPGSIPYQKSQFATFDESIYMANPFLCRPPLPKDCNEPNSP
ncbi:hypothetical protein Gogos_003911 [Gossypium gossypioides]|uniref:Leucine-rich repeat-containing N-terminal plant-type domain-containing protein n=1 Tax=Gossypium gossypioides TaxID=34282 RepID=A0A7J9CNG8_GOSGO|nr:hypothetical protein [Gossypium gossypioides]